MKKAELIELIKNQLNIELENDKEYFLNRKRNVLYTKVVKENESAVFNLLIKLGIRYEQHLKDYYFIIL